MNLNSKLKARTLLATSALCALLVYACRKDLHPAGEELKNAANGLSLKEAKNYYTDLKKREGGTLELSNINLGRSAESLLGRSKPNKKYALFEKSIKGETYKSDFVEVPITYDQRVTTIRTSTESNTTSKDRQAMFRNSFDRLVIYKSKSTGEIKNVLISYVPSATYLKTKGSKLKDLNIRNLRDFTGYLEFKKWNGASSHIVEYRNGSRTRVYKTPKPSAIKNDRTQESNRATTMSIFCHYEMVEQWVMICVGGDAGEDGSGEQYCSLQLVSSEWVEVCQDDGSTGDPCIDYGYCDNDDDDCILFGLCNPNEPENPSSPPAIVIVDQSILNNPKIKCLLSKLLGGDGKAGNPEFTGLLEAFKEKGFDLTIKIGDTHPNSKGETSPDPNDPTKFNIVLNKDKIDDESQMSWAKTLLHEAFHAQLIQKAYEVFGTTAINLWNTKPEDMTLAQLMDWMEMKGLSNNHPFFPAEHHDYMAENFEVIRDGLKSFSASYNTNHNQFTDNHFNGLAYEGLHDSSYYQNVVSKNSDGSPKMMDFFGTPTPVNTVFTSLSAILQSDSSIPCD